MGNVMAPISKDMTLYAENLQLMPEALWLLSSHCREDEILTASTKCAVLRGWS